MNAKPYFRPRTSSTAGRVAKYVLFAVAAFVAIAVTGSILQHLVYSRAPSYATSEVCADCHPVHYRAWREETLHPVMFRPVSGPDDILADFSRNDPAVTFTKDQIEFVIGNKWEQVYARKIDGEYYPFPAKWYVATQEWVPYKVDTWRETPLSTKCNGCHTTGFNPDTYDFSEFGIGCEACHGPASNHVAAYRASADLTCAICHDHIPVSPAQDVIVSIKSAVCGQCHTRGSQVQDKEHIQTTFNFPLNITPGEPIGDKFELLTKDKDNEGKFWWGVGLSRNRHQEFADFALSKHAMSLTLMRRNHTPAYGELTDECLACHSADYILAAPGSKPTLATAAEGLTCATCHEPHGLDRLFKIARPVTGRCGSCHGDGLSWQASGDGKPHYPGPPNSATCPDCHMPYIVESGGTFPIRSHAFKIVPPSATKAFGIPNSCQNGGCHADRSVDWTIREFEAFYGTDRTSSAHAGQGSE